MLSDGAANERGAAAVALGQIGDREAVLPLLARAADEAACRARRGRLGIGGTGRPAGAGDAGAAAADDDPETAEAAREALGKMRAG